jgi:hypothetical protein
VTNAGVRDEFPGHFSKREQRTRFASSDLRREGCLGQGACCGGLGESRQASLIPDDDESAGDDYGCADDDNGTR